MLKKGRNRIAMLGKIKKIFAIALMFLLLFTIMFTMQYEIKIVRAYDPPGYDIYVDDDASPAWYDATHKISIRQGVIASNNGDDIYVHSGNYTVNSVDVDKEVAINGENPFTTIVFSTSTGGTMKIYNDNTTITNFTFQNSVAGSYRYGLNIDGSNVTVSHCIFDHCYWGIDIEMWSRWVNVSNCNFTNCLSDGVGVILYASVDHCYFWNNNFNCTNGLTGSNAYDDSDGGNFFDNGTVGNWWDDYIGVGVYTVPAGALGDGVDNFPLLTMNPWWIGYNTTIINGSGPGFISIDAGINGSSFNNPRPTLIWSKKNNTAFYDLQIANDSIFTDIILEFNISEYTYPYHCSINGTQVSFTLPTDLPYKRTYYVRVRAYILS